MVEYSRSFYGVELFIAISDVVNPRALHEKYIEVKSILPDKNGHVLTRTFNPCQHEPDGTLSLNNLGVLGKSNLGDYAPKCEELAVVRTFSRSGYRLQAGTTKTGKNCAFPF